MGVIKRIIQKKQSNSKGLIVLETNVRNDVKLTTGNKKRNKCVNVLENFGFLEMKGGVFGNVNTLMEVRNMNEDFLAAAIVAEKSLQRLQEIIDSMVDEELEPNEE